MARRFQPLPLSLHNVGRGQIDRARNLLPRRQRDGVCEVEQIPGHEVAKDPASAHIEWIARTGSFPLKARTARYTPQITASRPTSASALSEELGKSRHSHLSGPRRQRSAQASLASRTASEKQQGLLPSSDVNVPSNSVILCQGDGCHSLVEDCSPGDDEHKNISTTRFPPAKNDHFSASLLCSVPAARCVSKWRAKTCSKQSGCAGGFIATLPKRQGCRSALPSLEINVETCAHPTVYGYRSQQRATWLRRIMGRPNTKASFSIIDSRFGSLFSDASESVDAAGSEFIFSYRSNGSESDDDASHRVEAFDVKNAKKQVVTLVEEGPRIEEPDVNTMAERGDICIEQWQESESVVEQHVRLLVEEEPRIIQRHITSISTDVSVVVGPSQEMKMEEQHLNSPRRTQTRQQSLETNCEIRRKALQVNFWRSKFNTAPGDYYHLAKYPPSPDVQDDQTPVDSGDESAEVACDPLDVDATMEEYPSDNPHRRVFNSADVPRPPSMFRHLYPSMESLA